MSEHNQTSLLGYKQSLPSPNPATPLSNPSPEPLNPTKIYNVYPHFVEKHYFATHNHPSTQQQDGYYPQLTAAELENNPQLPANFSFLNH